MESTPELGVVAKIVAFAPSYAGLINKVAAVLGCTPSLEYDVALPAPQYQRPPVLGADGPPGAVFVESVSIYEAASMIYGIVTPTCAASYRAELPAPEVAGARSHAL